MVLVVVVFALLWLPIHVFLLIVYFYAAPSDDALWPLAVYVLCTALSYLNSCVNPIIYNRTSKDFRDAFRSAVGCQKRVKADGDAVAMTPQHAGPAAAAAKQRRDDDGPKPATEDVEYADGKIHVEN